VGRVFQRQELLLAATLAASGTIQPDEQAYADGVRSYIIVPLVVHDRSIGVLAVASVNPGQYFEKTPRFSVRVANQGRAGRRYNMKAYEEIAALKARLERESVYLQEEIPASTTHRAWSAIAPPLRALLRQVEQVAPMDSTVLIAGETGTGKELIARAIHASSGRRERRVGQGQLQRHLGRAGRERALRPRQGRVYRRDRAAASGRFELQMGGTIFLVRWESCRQKTQVKLLRVAPGARVEPVGSQRTQPVNVASLPRPIAIWRRRCQRPVPLDLFFRLKRLPAQCPAPARAP